METDEKIDNPAGTIGGEIPPVELVEKTILPTVIPEEIDLVVVTMDQVSFEGKIKSLIAPGPWGNFAILPGHTPLFTKLEKGTLVIHSTTESTEINIEGGIAKITQEKIVILIGF